MLELGKRALCLLLMCLGALMVRATVDISPVIGSPQIDYIGFKLEWSFGAQLAVDWIVYGIGSALITALAITAWGNDPVAAPPLSRPLLVWSVGFVAIASIQFAMFRTWGTMGPINVQQPIVRFALINGAISATVIAAVHGICSHVLARPTRGPRVMQILVSTVTVFCVFAGPVLAIIILAGLPLGQAMASYAPRVGILAVVATVLIALTRRSVGPGPVLRWRPSGQLPP